MKQELMENLIRYCAREVLAQIRENSGETKGAPAPPADGLGTAEQPPIPKKTSGALEVDENIRKMIKKVVNEILDTK